MTEAACCKHLVSIEELSTEELIAYLDDSVSFCEVAEREIKKVPSLRGKTIINLFLEPSTRTRVSFELAGKRLSADTINISSSESSQKKGESLYDTALTLESMAPDILVVRHRESGAAEFLRRHLQATSIVNAGDGMHEHPTQALLDCLSLMRRKGRSARDLRGLKVCIVGDVLHSRVARSNIWAHQKLGNRVTLVGPPALVPSEFSRLQGAKENVHTTSKLEEGLEGADVVMVLRMQLERQGQFFVPSLEEYTRLYGISESRLKRLCPEALVLHPGPANRGIEISSEVLDGPRSLFREQVRNGVAVRMAVLFRLATGKRREEGELHAER